MATKTKSNKQEAQNPLILRCHRLMEAFAKSNDERDFYIDRLEGFLVYADLDKTAEELNDLENELKSNSERYCPIPKLTLYETKKIMEGFVNEKVYDIDTKEKLLEIIQAKEARENFLEFIYDHHSELEKWQQYYQERSRIRIIEWLRQNNFHFVFEEDLELAPGVIEKLKKNLFEKSSAKDLESARKALISKAKTYYSNEALNPRPKRGRPPKQVQKMELEPQLTNDIFTTVPAILRPFLFTPEIGSLVDVTFSAKFENGRELMASRRPSTLPLPETITSMTQKLAALRQIPTNQWVEQKLGKSPQVREPIFELTEQDKAIFKKLDNRESGDKKTPAKSKPVSPQVSKKMVVKKSVKEAAPKKLPVKKAAAPKKAVKKLAPLKAAVKKPVIKKAPVKKAAAPKKVVIKKSLPKKMVLKKSPPKANKPTAKKMLRRR